MAKIWLYPNFALILCHKQNCHMKFEIKELEELSGKKARIYSVIIDGEEDTLLEQFFNENKNHADELQTMLSKIKTMADDTGCRRQFFAEGEGAWADGVVALKAGKLRLYGIYFNNTVVLVRLWRLEEREGLPGRPGVERKSPASKGDCKEDEQSHP